jgi:DNA polymerase-3 subunit beta|tara:strand:+ start:22 stop:1158 length:1137 start_codon:yes stop_codon:yes gene_type:complete
MARQVGMGKVRTMRFEASRADLIKPLQLVTGVIERRQTLPILANLLLKVSEDQLSLVGTDLEVELIGRIPLVSAEPGDITVPARKLMEICRELPEQATLAIKQEEQRLVIQSGRFRSTLSTLPASEFPTVDRAEISDEIEIASSSLKRLLDRTSFAMAHQDVRYFLNGLLLEIGDGHVRAVTTDGHRLALCELEYEGQPDKVHQVIVPRKGVQELQRLLGDASGNVGIALGSNHLCVEIGEFTFTTKLVDGRFPEYERVIPRDGDKVVLGDTQELRQALNRTAILSNEKFRGIRLSLMAGNLQLSANNPEQEEAEESVSVEYDGEALEMGFNVSYLIDVLSILDSDKVKITVQDANSSALLEEPESDDSIYVVMPMKL